MSNFWTLKMAWRDSRGSRKRLLLFLLSMVMGVAALVAINSFGENLERAVDEQSKSLLGADLSLESSRPFSKQTEALIDSLGGEQSRRISFSSMAYFPETEDTRLVTVRAIEGDYPYYGTVETSPASAASTYLADGRALVDGSLMEQFGAAIGDSLRIGNQGYRIAGRLLKTPRESEAIMLFSPRVYIPLAGLDTTLLQQGSRAEYEVYFKFGEEVNVDALAEELEPRFREQKVGFDTVGEIKDNWDEGLTNLYRFLSLVGFVALLLGGLGVASAVHVYVKQRIETVAVMRCLGARAWRTVRIYLLQAALMGLLGAGMGCLLGIGVQLLIPRVLADFLPVDVTFYVSWSAVLLGMGIGVGVTVLFALLPLVAVRKVSPLRALRSSYEAQDAPWRDPLRWVIYLVLAGAITTFALVQAPEPEYGFGYAAGVAAVFGLLALVAHAIMFLTRRFFPSSWSYPWRQGLANLYRPHNQTVILMLALGLGTFLIVTLFLVQRTLLAQIDVATGMGQPNMVLFDIQSDQLEGVTEIAEAQGLPVLDQVPIVTMRLSSVKGRTIDEIRADSTADLTWAHRREYRSTYRSELTESEEIVTGTFVGAVPEGTDVFTPRKDGPKPVVPVSLEQEITQELGVGLGDTLVFNVQGVPVTTTVSSVRAVDWKRLSTNFFVVFPEGVLEKAPQFHVLLTRTATEAEAARLQSAVVQAYPNVSAIDLSLVLNVFDAIFGRIAFVIRFMALFSVLTGLIVLAGAVIVSRYQRIEESVLLKTLGASRAQVLKIMLIEYLFLGLFATLTGLVLAVGANWALAYFVFEAPVVFAPQYLVVALFVVTGLTILIGLLNSRGIYDRPPLEVLRAEV